MNGRVIYPALAGLVFVIDRAAKMMVAGSMADGQVISLTAWFNLVNWRNPGVAFGLMQGSAWDYIILAMTALGMIALAVWMIKFGPTVRYGRVGLALALGGAAGNLYDRIASGEVIDFLDIHYGGLHWPAFNVADAAISTGFGLLILAFLKNKDKNRSAKHL